jgi:hypothetical protein
MNDNLCCRRTYAPQTLKFRVLAGDRVVGGVVGVVGMRHPPRLQVDSCLRLRLHQVPLPLSRKQGRRAQT